ncbi:pyrroloquinoline quinone biosynthesis peptide chaperone PqqD [Ventosimonas gracilis]|nr:pyrroloquinoline quinone biosynthesis peptide chaperone PqqD [Ventosimonas gracilis]
MMQAIPKLRRGFRLQFEPVQDGHVLLYPEGMIKLNASAAEILLLMDGQRSVAQIYSVLAERFPEAPGIEQDIREFIETAHAKHWIEWR